MSTLSKDMLTMSLALRVYGPAMFATCGTLPEYVTYLSKPPRNAF